ncbi:MAG: DUF5011 domain-containing protein [Akkermansiaceae bacterium]|nr:DUF5011 domain-containing protein [Akkermansiaceae bacterium]
MYPSSTLLSVAAFLGAACFAGAAASQVGTPDPARISASELASIAEAASKRWEATGLTEAQKATLRGLRYEVADLEDGVLGAYREGSIRIDINGAGQGWYVDATPDADEEFRNVGSATQLAGDGDLAKRVDVLSVVLQEQGHALGLEDSFSDAQDVMFAFYAKGVRLLPAKGQAEGSVPGSLRGTHYAHYRGGSVTHTVSSTGVVTIESYTVWASNQVSQPSFTIRTGANGGGSSLGIAAATHSNHASGTELGGSGFTVRRSVSTFTLSSAGTYYAYWTGGNRVGGINNAPESTWALETCIKWNGAGTTAASPTQREATIDIIARGHTYTQNLNSVDPDGKPVSFQFLTGSAAPYFGPTTQIPGINLDSLGNVNISSANTATLATGRWVYKTRVTDADGAYSDRDVTVVVENSTGGAGNNPNAPVLAYIPNRTVAVGSPLTFGVSATDADNDQLTIRAQLLPSGATLPQVVAPNGSVSSTFNWTPIAGQEGVYTINVEAFDSNRPVPIIASQLVQITVTGSNTPPVLDPIGNKTVANGGTVSFTVSGSDPDGDTITLSEYFLPAGATFNAATGAFTWTPAAGQYDNTVTGVTFRITDNGVPNLYTEETINITVGAGNAAPVITPVATVSAQVGQPLTIPITVTDAAGQTITVTAPIRPSGSTFTSTPGTSPVSGTFSWTPSAAGTETLRIRAEDNGSPILSSTYDITIEVTDNLPPVVTLNGANPITLECYVDFYTEYGATAVDPEDGPLTLAPIAGTVDRTHVGTYTRTYTATDSKGLSTSVTRTIHVVDTRPPVITVPANILIPSVVKNPSGPTLSNPVFYAPTVTASDVATGNRLVTLSHPTGTRFPVGRTTVTATASDPSGNTATTTFDVIVLEHQESPGVRFMDVIAYRGEPATGAPLGTIFNVNRAFVNNRSDVIYDAALSGAGANDTAVFYGPLNGAQTVLAVKGTASGVGNFGAFSNLTLNHLGDAGFESLVGSTPAQFRSAGGAAAVVSAAKSGAAPTGGGEAFSTLYQPAMSSNGLLLTPATLQLGSGAGVTVANDTLLVTSGGGVLAREGSPTGVAGVSYGQLHPRVVASRANEKYAFSAFLETPVFDPDTNTGLFVGTVGGGAPDLVVREGNAANGVTGARIFQFLGESVNSAGEIAFRATITGTGVTAANNDGIWSNSGAVGSPPVLVARKGAIVPLAPANRIAFSRFTALHMQDDGSVVFHAFLQDATAVAVVNSNNDGSIWRWSGGRLTLLAREGDLANNTAGGRLLNINGFDCNDMGGIVYDATLVPGVGDTTTATNQAVFINRGNGLDPAPLLAMRRNDSFEVMGAKHIVAGIKISTSVNSGGGTGGYGRAINDSGEVVFNLTLSGLPGPKSGIFLLGSAPN